MIEVKIILSDKILLYKECRSLYLYSFLGKIHLLPKHRDYMVLLNSNKEIVFLLDTGKVKLFLLEKAILTFNFINNACTISIL